MTIHATFFEPETEPSDRTPILFLHSALGTMKEFDRIAPAFRDRRQILLDIPGHGKTTALSGDYTSQAIAAEIVKFLDKQVLKQVDIIGYSLGGYLGIEMAIASHQKVRSIVSHAMKFYWNDASINSAVQSMNWDVIPEQRQNKLEAAHSASGAIEVLEANKKLIAFFRKRMISSDEIKQTGVPILFSVGDNDDLVPLEEILRLYEALGDDQSALVVHPNTRHPISSLDPGQLERATRQFWKTMF